MIISFSGIDSAGKSTQVELLSKYYKDKNIPFKVVWSKARGTPGIIFLKSLVRRDKRLNDSEKIEYRNKIYSNGKKAKVLYALSLLDLCWYWGVYYRILGSGNRVLICDRYLWDTYIELRYDFQGIDVNNSKLWKLVKKCAPVPKVSFVFVVPPEVSLERDRQKDADGIESVERKKQKIETYLECIQNGCWTDIMDGMKSIDDLHKEVIGIINKAI